MMVHLGRLLAVPSLVGLCVGCVNGSETSVEGNFDVHSVLSAALQVSPGGFAFQTVAISDSSCTHSFAGTTLRATLISILGQDVIAEPQILDDFLEGNERTRVFQNLFVRPTTKLFLLEAAETESLTESGWRKWRNNQEIFRSASGIVRFSYPGFNSDRSRALVYWELQHDNPTAAMTGQYVLLRRRNGAWETEESIPVWALRRLINPSLDVSEIRRKEEELRSLGFLEWEAGWFKPGFFRLRTDDHFGRELSVLEWIEERRPGARPAHESIEDQ